ncbi:hypothetical protein FV140_04015 [Paenarthrobacter ureafaciens]|nr:hypothetical protein FV140_04015 [Paenarthrobacter ureafaciens]
MAGVLAGADDGGATGVEAAGAEVVADAVVPAVEVGPVVALGLALLVVGDGLGGPKQAVRTIRLLSPRMQSAENLGLVMMPP